MRESVLFFDSENMVTLSEMSLSSGTIASHSTQRSLTPSSSNKLQIVTTAEYCDERVSVCLSVRLSVCICLFAIISSELHVQSSRRRHEL